MRKESTRFKLDYFVFALCVTLLRLNSTESSNILGLFTSPHRSHMLVYMSVVKNLLHRGHNVTILTVLPIREQPVGALRVIQLNKPPESGRRMGMFRQIEVAIVNSRVFEDEKLQHFLDENNRFDLVIVGYFFNDYQLGLGAHYNCPVVIIWTGQPISFVNRFVGNPNGWWYVPQPFVRSQAVGIRGLLHGIFEIGYQYIFDVVMDNVYKKLFHLALYPTLNQMRKNVSLVLCNHHYSEGLVAAHLPTIVEIGGIQIEENKEIPRDLKQFMDQAESGVIYFSLGTVVNPKQLSPSVIRSFESVFSKLPQRILWKIDYVSQNYSNIVTSTWFPQTSILDHPKTKLFITHAGKGSTVEAIHHAVPTIAIPIFGDQFGDANRLVNNGFGVRLDAGSITDESLYNCISEVLNNASYARKIRTASEIYKDRPISAKATAVYWIEYVLRYKGTPHMQTLTKSMNFIQYLNIDVYLFCFCALHGALAAMNLLIFSGWSVRQLST